MRVLVQPLEARKPSPILLPGRWQTDLGLSRLRESLQEVDSRVPPCGEGQGIGIIDHVELNGSNVQLSCDVGSAHVDQNVHAS